MVENRENKEIDPDLLIKDTFKGITRWLLEELKSNFKTHIGNWEWNFPPNWTVCQGKIPIVGHLRIKYEKKMVGSDSLQDTMKPHWNTESVPDALMLTSVLLTLFKTGNLNKLVCLKCKFNNEQRSLYFHYDWNEREPLVESLIKINNPRSIYKQ